MRGSILNDIRQSVQLLWKVLPKMFLGSATRWRKIECAAVCWKRSVIDHRSVIQSQSPHNLNEHRELKAVIIMDKISMMSNLWKVITFITTD
jgi:hypothetical protein